MNGDTLNYTLATTAVKFSGVGPYPITVTLGSNPNYTVTPSNGILTVNTEAQAWARARASELNKGGDAARAALAMLRIKRRLARA